MSVDAPFRIAVSAAFWGNPIGDNLRGWLADVRKSGFDGVTLFVDFWVWGDGLADGRDVREALVAEGLGLASLVTSVHDDLDRYRRAAAVLRELDCHHLVVIGGEGRRPDDRIALAARLDALGRAVGDVGIRASYHHHTATAGETFGDVTELMRLTDPEAINLTFDAGHATKDFVDLPIEHRAAVSLDRLWDRIDLVELKDWSPDSDLDTPVGGGLADAGALVDALTTRGYADWLVVEQNDDLGRSSDDKLACATRSLAFIRAHEHSRPAVKPSLARRP